MDSFVKLHVCLLVENNVYYMAIIFLQCLIILATANGRIEFHTYMCTYLLYLGGWNCLNEKHKNSFILTLSCLLHSNKDNYTAAAQYLMVSGETAVAVPASSAPLSRAVD